MTTANTFNANAQPMTDADLDVQAKQTLVAHKISMALAKQDVSEARAGLRELREVLAHDKAITSGCDFASAKLAEGDFKSAQTCWMVLRAFMVQTPARAMAAPQPQP
jgi:hypothetical protein